MVFLGFGLGSVFALVNGEATEGLILPGEGRKMLGQRRESLADGAPERHLINGVIDSLKTAWLKQNPLFAVATCLRVLAPKSQLVFALEGPGRSFPSEDRLPSIGASPACPVLSPTSPPFRTFKAFCDSTPNEIVSSAAMSRRDKRSFEEARADLFHCSGLWHLMGTTLGSTHERLATVVFARSKRWGDFRAIERARLLKVLPSLRDGLLSLASLSRANLAVEEAAALINCFGSPASIHGPSGELVCFNEAALRSHRHLLEIQQRRNESSCPRRSRAFFELDGRLSYLVVHRHRSREQSQAEVFDKLAKLPSSLAQVAKHILRGLSDKEIADAVGLPVSTVRTYTYRIYRRVGVKGRGHLLSAVLSTNVNVVAYRMSVPEDTASSELEAS